MKKRKFLFFIFALLLISFVQAQPPFEQETRFTEGYEIRFPSIGVLEQNEDFNFHFHIYNLSNGVPIDNSSTNCDFHLYDNKGDHIISEPNITYVTDEFVINEWGILVTGGNFTKLGSYSYIISCNSDNLGGFASIHLDVTYLGDELSIYDSLARISLLIFFIGLLFLIYKMVSKIDFEKWNNKIMEKYKNKNFVKMVLSSMAYNSTKHIFMIYYLIGLIIIMIVADIILTYNITSLIDLISAILLIYTIGILIVGIVFLSYVQEWVMDIVEQIRNLDWGITS